MTANKAEKEIQALTDKFKELEDMMDDFKEIYKTSSVEKIKAKNLKKQYCEGKLKLKEE